MNKDIKRILEIANEFLQVPSSIGFEKPFLDYLNSKIKKLGYTTIQTDKYLIVKNNNPTYLFSAHIDRHSVIKNKKDEIEYLGFYLKKQDKSPFKRDLINYDELALVEDLKNDGYTTYLTDKHIFIEKDDLKLRFIREGGEDFYEKVALRYMYNTLYSYNPLTGEKLNKFKITKYDVDHKIPIVKFYLEPKPQNEDKIFAMNSQIRIDGNLFSGQIDNVISAAILFYLLETTNFKNEIIFTTQEESSKSYLCVIDYLETISYNPKLIVIDTTPYENFKKLKTGSIVLRKGDENGMFDEKLVKEIEDFVKKNEIPYLYKSSKIGITELGRVATSTNEKFNGATVQLPTKNYHTIYETSTLESLENYYKIINIFCRNQ